MIDSIFFIAGLATAFIGTSWLALSLPSRWRQVHAQRELTQHVMLTLRTLGALALPTSLALFQQIDGVMATTAVWLLSILTAVWLVTRVLALRPGWLAVLSGSLSRLSH